MGMVQRRMAEPTIWIGFDPLHPGQDCRYRVLTRGNQRNQTKQKPASGTRLDSLDRRGRKKRSCWELSLSEARPAKPLRPPALRIPPSSRLSPQNSQGRIKFFPSPFTLPSPPPPHPPSFFTPSSCLSPSGIRRPISRSLRTCPFPAYHRKKKKSNPIQGPRKTHRPAMLPSPLTPSSPACPVSRRVSVSHG